MRGVALNSRGRVKGSSLALEIYTLSLTAPAVLDVGGPFWIFEARERSKTMPYAPQFAVTGPLIFKPYAFELRVETQRSSRCISGRGACRGAAGAGTGPEPHQAWWIPEPSRALGEQSRWVRAAIEEAHRAGVRVAVHATQVKVARAAVLAGADVLVHSVDDHRVDDGFVRLLRKRDVVIHHAWGQSRLP